MVELLLHFALAFEELVHFIVGHFFRELAVDLFKLFEQLDGILHGFLDHFAHGARIVDQRFLLQVADGITRRENRLAVDLLVHARHDAQQR